MPPLWSRLGELTMPVLLIAGGADPAYLEDMGRMAEAISGAIFEVFPETGHAIHREWPERLVEVVQDYLISTAKAGKSAG